MQGVLQGDDLGWGTVDVTIVWDIVALDVLEGHVVAIGWDHWDYHGLGQDGQTSCLVCVDVRSVVAQDGVRWLVQVRSQSDLVGQRTGDTEQTGLHTGQLCDVLLETDGVDVLVVDSVTNRSLQSSLLHLPGRSGESVGTQVIGSTGILWW